MMTRADPFQRYPRWVAKGNDAFSLFRFLKKKKGEFGVVDSSPPISGNENFKAS
jgi:hypothetical protein